MEGELSALLFLDQWVVTPLNLSAFMTWAATAEFDEMLQVFGTVYIVNHRMNTAIFGDIPHGPIVIPRSDFRCEFVVNEVDCEDDECIRCNTGRGGYQFRWVGPWTCECMIGSPDMDAQQVMQRYRECTLHTAA